MTDQFSEYRRLFQAHIESSNKRQDAMEDQLTEIKVAMGVFTVKLSLIVGAVVLVGGIVATSVVRTSVDAVLESQRTSKEDTSALRLALESATKALNKAKDK